MKIAVFNENRLGIVEDNQLYDVTESVDWDSTNVQASMENLMENFNDYRGKIESRKSGSQVYKVKDVKLQAPVPNPSKIIAAPVNYLKHQDEMNKEFNNAKHTVEILKLFLKAPSSIIGPEETVLLPYKDRRHDHEAEVAFVIGKKAKDIKASQASDYIFGYCGLMDMTLRGEEERTFRKSFDTFTPIGPWIVTSDEIGDPHDLEMDLWVNEDHRQSTNTKLLILDCYKCLEIASHNMTLLPGDIITTGTPDGVGPITKGDKVTLKIERIGEFSVSVDYKE
jgi:2-keto-4-pentenoate hydratase/2-oxohepta-3-ene-1,7-dioic acid hydratase in catechol pathway